MKKNQIRINHTLNALIEEYIESNEPVSSRVLQEKYFPDISSATLRLDLLKLEKYNLIQQPHTSAGRKPTILGYRYYLNNISKDLDKISYPKMDILRELLIKNYKDTPKALHIIMQLLAQETDQLSFIAEPEVSNGYLEKLDVFQIGINKILFVMSLDSGLDKTVVMKCDYEINSGQLRKLVRYLNDELSGLRIYDIANKFLVEMRQSLNETSLMSFFLQELHQAFIDISDFFIHFDTSNKFLERPEFDNKVNILSFFNLIQRQDLLLKLMRNNDKSHGVKVLLGEDLTESTWSIYTIIYARYEIFGIPGYLGIIAPVRCEYKKLIPLVRDIAKTITLTTKKGMIVPHNMA